MAKKSGKFYIQTTLREYFATAEDRERHIKKHPVYSFDDKLALITGAAVEESSKGSQVQMITELKEVQE